MICQKTSYLDMANNIKFVIKIFARIFFSFCKSSYKIFFESVKFAKIDKHLDVLTFRN